MLRDELRALKSGKRELRSFVITLGLAFWILAIVLYWRDIFGTTIALGLRAALLLAGLFLPRWLRAIYKPWMAFAIFLGFIMTRVLLTVVFVLLFIPTGLLMRLFGRDPLRQKLDPNANSYWIPKNHDPENTERLERMY